MHGLKQEGSKMEDLYRPTKDDFPKLVQTFVNAFFDYPLYVHAIPEITEREKKLKANFKMMVRYGFKFGDMYASSENIEGVAIYIHPESGPMTTWRWIQCGILGLMRLNGSAVQKRYNKAIAAIEPLKKKYAPSPFLTWVSLPSIQDCKIKVLGASSSSPCWIASPRKIERVISRHSRRKTRRSTTTWVSRPSKNFRYLARNLR